MKGVTTIWSPSYEAIHRNLLEKQPYIALHRIDVGGIYIHMPTGQEPKLVQITGYKQMTSNPDSLREFYVREIIPGYGLSPDTFMTAGFFLKEDIYGMAQRLTGSRNCGARHLATPPQTGFKAPVGLKNYRRRIRHRARSKLRLKLEMRN